ncbi:MAG: hypothetical protein RLO17_27315 [Cyclobacteriaceae bacterium]
MTLNTPKMIFRFLPLVVILISVLTGCTEKQQAKNHPKYLTYVKSYADAMIQNGRDVYGAEHSPLFASALNRQTFQVDESIDTISISGVRVTDRSVTGANMIHDVDLFTTLYDLAAITGEARYGEEADKAMNFFFNTCQSEATNFYCWGEHLYWDFQKDDCGLGADYHENSVWPYWDKAYEMAPDAVWNFTLAEWDHQIHDKTTGDFSRHAGYTKHETYSGFDFPRYAGQLMERWAYAYNRPENAGRARREELPHYIEVMVNRMQDNMAQAASGLLIAGRSPKGDHNQVVWLTSNLELARCLDVAAPIMEASLAEEMRGLALKQDQDFFNAPHKLDSVGGGFAVTLHAETGLPRVRSMNKPYSAIWSSGYGYGTHAGVANIIYVRQGQLDDRYPDMANRYREMILKVGEIYLESEPDTTLLLKPNEFAQVIELMLNCYELSDDQRFLDRAAFFADRGIELFMDGSSPLPKVTNQHDHYETITGGPSFMYQLLNLHQALNK